MNQSIDLSSTNWKRVNQVEGKINNGTKIIHQFKSILLTSNYLEHHFLPIYASLLVG